MQEHTQTLAGLDTVIVGAPAPGQPLVVLLHGYDMKPEDLAPFTHSIKVPALFLVPRGPLETPTGNRAWWSIDAEAKAHALLSGPRDLANEQPPGTPPARQRLKAFLEAAIAQFQPRCLILGGFSQGGMLACDFLLEEASPRVAGLFLLSSSRIRVQHWETRRDRLGGLPVLISHGRQDDDLAFAAGERLKDFAVSAGARVTWVPTDAGHQIPLIVWRELRKFISALLK